MKKILLITLFLVFAFTIHVHAGELDSDGTITDELINERLNMLEIDEPSNVINEKMTIAGQIDFKTLILQVIKGEIKITVPLVVDTILRSLFEEIYLNASLLRNLLIIAVLSAVLKNLSDSFKNKAVGELGFYVCYIVLVMVLYTSYEMATGIIEDLIISLHSIMEATIPLMTSLTLMSGQVAAAVAFNPTTVFAIYFITSFIKNVLLPVILLAATIEIVNYISAQDILTKFSKLIKTVISWTLKGIAFLIMGILSLQRVSAPILSNLAVKTAKGAVKTIPVVGEIMTGAVDTVMYFATAVKSGVLIAVLIAVILICAIPLIKICAFILVYKFTAAVIQPVCDKRIVECIDSIGSFSVLLFSTGITVVFMFSIIVIMFLTI